jgi:hypothetical protein
MPESMKRKPSLPSQIVRHEVENACPFQRIIDAGELPSFKRCQGTYLPELLTLIPLTPGFTRGPHLNVQQLAPRKGTAGEQKCFPLAGLKTADAPASSRHALHPSAIDPSAAHALLKSWTGRSTPNLGTAQGATLKNHSSRSRQPAGCDGLDEGHENDSLNFTDPQPKGGRVTKGWLGQPAPHSFTGAMRCRMRCVIGQGSARRMVKNTPLRISPAMRASKQTATSCSRTTGIARDQYGTTIAQQKCEFGLLPPP